MPFIGIHKKAFLTFWLGLLIVFLSSCSAPRNNADLIRLRTLKDQAFAGAAESQYRLGMHYTTNGQWDWDRARGYNWFVEAANAGHPDAQYMVGMGQLLGRGTLQDQAGAIDWLTRAAEEGHSRSQYQVGQAYLNGTGVKKDSLWGRYWLEQAAWSGHSQAQFLLAALFKKGLGGQKNIAEAWAWLKRSGQNGNKEAEAVLAKLTLSLTETQKQRGRQLLKKAERVAPGGLYQAAKVRYVQASLNEIGFSAGGEDGEYGPATRSALARYLQKKELPGDSSIDRVIRSLRGRD